MESLNSSILSGVRSATSGWVFSKRLPQPFDRASMLVAPRADLGHLRIGWGSPMRTLFHVVDLCVRPGDVVWDVGSNLGAFSIAAAVRAGRDGAVYSIEADPRYASLQQRSAMSLDPSCASMSILCAAAGDRAGLQDFVVVRKGHARNHLAGVSGNEAGEEEFRRPVVCLTLDSLLDSWRTPSVVKIDVESAEHLVLRGSARLLREVRPRIYLESSHENHDELDSVLRERGYRYFKLAGSAWTPTDSLAFNSLVVPEERAGDIPGDVRSVS